MKNQVAFNTITGSKLIILLCIPVPVLFMYNYLSFGCVFSLILALFRPPGSGYRSKILPLFINIFFC
jgi:hypothetical protein